MVQRLSQVVACLVNFRMDKDYRVFSQKPSGKAITPTLQRNTYEKKKKKGLTPTADTTVARQPGQAETEEERKKRLKNTYK